MSIFMQNILEPFFPFKASPECLISPINVLHRSNQNVHQTLTATFVLVGKLQVGCCLDLIHQMFAMRLCCSLFHQDTKPTLSLDLIHQNGTLQIHPITASHTVGIVL